MLTTPALPDNCVLLVEVASTAHGTGIAGFRSLMPRTQPEGTRSRPGDTDRTLLSLRRFGYGHVPSPNGGSESELDRLLEKAATNDHVRPGADVAPIESWIVDVHQCTRAPN